MSSARFLIPAAALLVGLGVGAVAVDLAGARSGSPTSSSTSPVGPTGQARGTPGNVAMMGNSGAMMGGAGSAADIPGGAPGGLVPSNQLESLAANTKKAAQIRGSNVTYTRRQVTVVALAAPGNRPGMYWQIDGVDGPNGPNVSVPAGSTITVDFADGDPGQPHGFELTTAAPPYPSMAMMAGHIAAPGAFIMPVPPPRGQLWYAATVTFQAPAPGNYYFICPVPGHAQQGMWGTLTVR